MLNVPGFASMVIDLVIGITLLEGIALVLLHSTTGRGVAPGEFLWNGLAGLLLMLALRCAVREIGTAWLVLCLLGAGLAHATDLSRRWRRSRASRSNAGAKRNSWVS